MQTIDNLTFASSEHVPRARGAFDFFKFCRHVYKIWKNQTAPPVTTVDTRGWEHWRWRGR